MLLRLERQFKVETAAREAAGRAAAAAAAAEAEARGALGAANRARGEEAEALQIERETVFRVRFSAGWADGRRLRPRRVEQGCFAGSVLPATAFGCWRPLFRRGGCARSVAHTGSHTIHPGAPVACARIPPPAASQERQALEEMRRRFDIEVEQARGEVRAQARMGPRASAATPSLVAGKRYIQKGARAASPQRRRAAGIRR
jgi:hypothetical protein